MLPIWFQGLGLPKSNIDILSSKAQSLQRHWNTSSVTGTITMYKHAYEVFQVEAELGGTMFRLMAE